MKSGQTFTLDALALAELSTFSGVTVDELTKKINEGDVFSIAKSEDCKGAVIRASKWENGKPKRGRPRRFPAALVARLLGEDYDAPPTQEEQQEALQQAEEVADADLEAHAASLLTSEVAEEDAEPVLTAADVFPDEDDDDDW